MAEVITVVGGGIIGLTTAFELTERGQRVRVYDPTPGERGTGASYFAGGMLAPIAEVQFQQDALFPLMVASANAYPSLMRRLAAVTDAPTGYDTTGTLVVAGDRADAAHLRDVSEYYRSLNRSAEAIPVSRARALEPALTPDLAGAALIEGDHQLAPRLFLQALVKALRARGVEFVRERVTDPDFGDIVCTGLGAAGQYPLRPVYGDILRLQTPHPLVEHVVRGFVNGRPVYVIPRPGGEVCIGATSREDTRTRPGVDGVYQLLKDAIRVVPAVEECELIESNVGVRPGTPDDLPIFGDRTTATGRRQLISNGYFRHGILLAALAGKAGAEVFLGGDIPPEFAPCSPKRFEH